MSAAFDILSDVSQGPTMALIDAIDHGLPIRAVDRLADEVAPTDRNFRYKLVSRATYARRKARGAQERLSKVESDRVVRFARLWDLAVRVWKDEAAARDFLERPHMLLDGRTPMAVTLSGEQGGRMVEDILGRLQHGTGV